MTSTPSGFHPPSGMSSSPGGSGGAPRTTGGPMSNPPQPSPSQTAPMVSPSKDLNIASLCIMGQYLVQDVVNKTSDMFAILKQMQLPNGTVNTVQTIQSFQERKAKLNEQIQLITVNMKHLRMIYEKVCDNTAGMQGSSSQEDFLPIEVNGEMKGEKPKITEVVEYVSEDHRRVVEQIQFKNQQLKEIIDQFRTIVWEITTMMAMRKI